MTRASEHSPLGPSKARDDDASAGDTQLLAEYPDLLSVQDMHQLTGLSEQTIRAEINNGNLPGFRIGRRLYVSKKHLLEYIENGGGLNG